MKGIIWILAAGFLLRLIGLNQSLWQDEAISANVARNLSYQQIVTQYSPQDFHPPLYYFLLKAWSGVFGTSEISLRMPSVIFGVATVLIVYWLAGEWGAILTAVNPLLVYYSQEARMYSLATFLVVLGFYGFKKKKYWLLGGMMFLSFLTFYGVVFLWMALGLFLVWQKKWKEILLSFGGLLAAILLISPLLRQQITYSRGALTGISGWGTALGKVTVKNLLLFPVKFSVGRISFYPKVVYWLIAGGWGILMTLAAGVGLKKQKETGVLVLLTLFLGVAFSVVSPLLTYFRFLYLVPFFVILISQTKLKKVAAIGFLVFSLVYTLGEQFHREDWKSMSTDLAAGETVYMIPSASDPLLYYRPDIRVANLLGDLPNEMRVIPFAADIYTGNYRQYLESKGYVLEKGKSYRQMAWEKWKLKSE